MADPLVGATAQVLLEKILSLATDRIGLVLGFKKDVETLKRSVDNIRAVLADAEKNQQQMEAMKVWLKRIEEVAYEADDVFDELNYECLRRDVETTQNPPKDKVCFSFFSSSRTVTFRWRIARKVRDINLKLKLINKEANGFGLQSQMASGSNTSVHHLPSAEVQISRETDSFVDQNVVGREDDASKIVEKLLSPSTKAVSFIPITGMGGLGKTTLAQLVYNDAQIDNNFESKIWVCVSDNFDVTRVFKLILESLRRKSVDIVSREAIVQEIKKELQGKKYLLILDDVWCQSSTTWDDFLRSLMGISTVKGNWSLVTTRLQQVASIVTANPPFVLRELSDDDCWKIMKGKAFLSGEVHEELNAIKEKIIGACQGVPLVASVIGGLLRINAKEKWLSIVRNEIPNMTSKMDSVMQILRLSFDHMQILRLSFDHLPSAAIKKCFAYCSLFKKDSEMEKDKLIQLWMAESFLQPNHGNEMEMEEIGLTYFDILVKSSLFQEVTNGYGVVCGRMHDLVHNLAQLLSKSETINLEQRVRNDNCEVRYLALESLEGETHALLKERSGSIRTMFIEGAISNDLLFHYKCLRVLDLSLAEIVQELPNSISKLIYLRYLDLSYSNIKALPESLCKLHNLQTLRLGHGIRKPQMLPRGMRNLISLRHLYYHSHDKELQMPLRMGKLTCLQTLEFFNIGRDKGRQIEEIGWLTNLRGSLTIRNLELVNGKDGARSANLFAKSKLTKLSLEWAEDREGDNDDENVLEGLEPHPNLQKLAVENFMGCWFPLWIMKMVCMDHRTNHLMRLNNLVELRLKDCKRCKEIPALGQLPHLKSLRLIGLDNVRCIGFSFYGVDNNYSSSGRLPKQSFPALECLRLESLPSLVDWIGVGTLGEVVEVFPKLEELSIWKCPQLTTTPNHFPCLKKLKMWGNDSNTELLVSSICNKVTTLTNFNINYTKGMICVPDVIFRNNTDLVTVVLDGCYDLMHVTSCSIASTRGNLRELFVSGCPNLKSIVLVPSGQQLPSSLRFLGITNCNALSSLPGEVLQSCTSLEVLAVCFCPNLVSFPVDLQQTPYLSYLDLSYCPKLITMPKGFGSCNNLRRLIIGPLSDSVELDWSTLSSSSVQKIELRGWPHSDSLPEQLQCLAEITELSLQHFGSIESLPDWLEKLASLEVLELNGCEKLMYLPSTEAMRHFTNLRLLEIYGCPMLNNRCTPSSNGISEWSKISHIPKITIDGVDIK